MPNCFKLHNIFQYLVVYFGIGFTEFCGIIIFHFNYIKLEVFDLHLIL